MQVTAIQAPLTVAVLAASLALVPSTPAWAGTGVVWLRVEAESDTHRVHALAPLEWLASIDRGEWKSELEVEGIDLDARELWKAYKDLPAGSTIEVARGVSKEGPYKVTAASEEPSRKTAEGKLHILARDRSGKVSDVRLPLDLPGLLAQILGSIVIDVSDDDGKHEGISLPGRAELMRLGGYGPFTLLESWEPDNQVKITIE